MKYDFDDEEEYNRKTVNLVGETFGAWQVIEEKNGKFILQCKCGHLREVGRYTVGKTAMCLRCNIKLNRNLKCVNANK